LNPKTQFPLAVKRCLTLLKSHSVTNAAIADGQGIGTISKAAPFLKHRIDAVKSQRLSKETDQL